MFFRLFTLLCTGQSVLAQRKQDKTYHQLVNRLFPEFFAPDHLRTTYSYHGQGKINKSELDPMRNGYVQRYVLYFHPDVKDPKFYQDMVVSKINEMYVAR
jgi:hypothetical protein